jgi:ComEC/Rec2-related protein
MSLPQDLPPASAADAPPRRALQPWLPWLALGLVVGGLAPGALSFATSVAWSTQVWWWLVGLPTSVIAVLLAQHYPWAGRWLLFAASCLLGAALCDGWGRRAPVDEPRLLAVTGTVMAVKWGGVSQGFLLAPTAVEAPTAYAPERRLFVRATDAFGLLTGDVVRVRGLWHRGERGDEVKAVSVERLELRDDGPRGWAWRALSRLGPHRELGESLILGLGDPPEKADFRQSGLLHILAVSGAHLAIAAGLGAWILRLLGLGWSTRQVALGLLIIGYTWLTSGSPATLRALVMGLAIVAAGLLAREPHRLGAVSLAALALLLIDPGNAHDLGFLLSLAAVLGIVTLGLDLVHLRQHWLPLTPWPLDRPTWRGVLFATRSTLDGLAIGLAASLATAPIISWQFGTVNPWSPLTTLLATPPTTVALWTGLPCLSLAGLWPAGPWDGLYVILDHSLATLVAVVQWSANLPGALLHVGAPSPWVLLAWPLLFLRLRDGTDIALRVVALGLLMWAW